MSWKNTTEGDEKYKNARATAQRMANASGTNFGIEANDYAKDYFIKGLPPVQFRFGHELRIEVVHPENLDNCKPGHGPMARAR